ncbi:uncharacterized protein LOC125235858 [Leguminivora glycinivorella]|uniref:uncharacterized protein LOC125235858 n=1 Tax=Leguminivora glycinivorella TaxID=1035111 RepID=UPI00200F76E9|nr:uncharacterized protein LOC125235858 [Leguminivora glycinivorella]
MGRELSWVVATLVLQAIWGCAFSSLLGPRTAATNIDNNDNQDQLNTNEYCHTCVKIDSLCYNHSYLFQLPAPFGDHPFVKRMAIMQATNVLYYNFQPAFADKEYSKVAFVSLNNPQYSGVISGWQSYNFDTFDINQNEKKVYLGGSDGIWVVNSTSRFPSFYGMRKNLITNIVVKDYVYFTSAERKGIYKYIDGYYVGQFVDKKINYFVMDNRYDTVYLNDSGLYISFSRQTLEDVRLTRQRVIGGLTADNRGTVYVWRVDGLYKISLSIHLSQSTLKRVSNIAPDAMTFDESNNIIYSIRNNLYKLTLVPTSKCFGL